MAKPTERKALAAGGATVDSHDPNIYLQRMTLEIKLSGKALAAGGATVDGTFQNTRLQRRFSPRRQGVHHVKRHRVAFCNFCVSHQIDNWSGRGPTCQNR